MELSEITLPSRGTFDFGVGLDRLSGTTKNLAVKPTPSAPDFALGGQQSIDVSRVTSTHDLQRSLGIDVNASYGCASFGAGASARFSFAENSQIHSSSLFMTVTCTAMCPDLSIPECMLTDAATSVAGNNDLFDQRYGNMFARSCKRGGLFVGVLRVETFDDKEANTIEANLHGSYGMFSAEASMKFSKITSDHNTNVYFTVYSEGGPPIQIHDPSNPQELLDLANGWLKALWDDPKTYAHPYEWTFSPMSIVEGPTPANAADIQHAQDVLMFCATERTTMLDQLNRLNWWLRHPDKYEWSDPDGVQQTSDAAVATQKDLDVLASCASAAMNDPKSAMMPGDFAVTKGSHYPLSLPLPKSPTPTVPTASNVTVPDLIHYSAFTDENNQPMPGLLRGVVNYLASLGLNYQVANVSGVAQEDLDMGTCTVTQQTPSPGSELAAGQTVYLQV